MIRILNRLNNPVTHYRPLKIQTSLEIPTCHRMPVYHNKNIRIPSDVGIHADMCIVLNIAPRIVSAATTDQKRAYN